MNKLNAFFIRAYRLSRNSKKQGEQVWKDLKHFHKKEQWRSAIVEKEKCIETKFEIEEGISMTFFYLLYDSHLQCMVRLIENFPEEYTTEFFIMATHFNNLLTVGQVSVNPNRLSVEFVIQNHILLPLLYTEEIKRMHLLHFTLAKDIYWAYQRILKEDEAPAIIIADLLKKYNEQNEKEAN